ncbi:PD-(D/E)XK motif protein [Cellulomonas hominis]|uniref:PD-(D/E)XK motif protein n=1 Tax=Cellulomonas hominis TaxID=156981 RepID=UPI001C126338|nr:PD-(D/E)XK motif protein [Cellulomonas hominis]MBU5423415.1 PD-(D/E)XK motif protein [Cellulomonas hominis]
MPDSSSPSYEWLREKIAGMPAATTGEARDLVWADGAKTLGVSRDEHGRVEIFLVGEPLVPRDRLVAENLVHNVWSTRSGGQLAASRLVLPSTRQLDGFAAFVCAELVENGLEHDRDSAFAQCEPVISMALRRAGISDQSFVGLAGELSVLAALIAAAADPSAVVACWAGSVPSSRDFQLGPVGVEVKTTTGSQSEHHIQGRHQVELGKSVGGAPETHLFLLSVGIRWQTVGSAGRTIPDLVEAVLGRLPEADDAVAFLDKVRQYGGDASVGYDHMKHAQNARFQQPFQLVFERLYDLTDDRIHLLRSPQIEQAKHVDADSVSFRVRLPTRVQGDINPTVGMSRVVSRLVTIAGV